MAQSQRPPLAQPRQERRPPPRQAPPAQASAPVPAPGRAANPFGSVGEVTVAARDGLISAEQQRLIAEVQARIILARANPRDPIRAMERILNDCTRPTLANAATYVYERGGTNIDGPTIRLLEAIAQRWGNLASGFKEVSRIGEYSECIAYAWDLESGYYDERQFRVRHWRDTKRGGYVVHDERDIYEVIANQAQRRKRACLLTVIPGDVTEAALDQCEQTMHASVDLSPEGVKRLVDAFAEFGVTSALIEQRIQRRLDAIRPAQVVQLRKIFSSLRDGMSEPDEWFEGVEDIGQTTDTGQTSQPAAASTGTAAPSGQPAGEGAGPGAQSQVVGGAATEPAKTDVPAGGAAQQSTPVREAAPGESPQASGEASAPSAGAPARRGRVNFEM